MSGEAGLSRRVLGVPPGASAQVVLDAYRKLSKLHHPDRNGGSEESIPSDLLIDARELERDLGDLAEQGAFFEPTGAGRREYVVRIKAGTVRWSEGNRGLPRELPRTQLLALRLDRLLCRS